MRSVRRVFGSARKRQQTPWMGRNLWAISRATRQAEPHPGTSMILIRSLTDGAGRILTGRSEAQLTGGRSGNIGAPCETSGHKPVLAHLYSERTSACARRSVTDSLQRWLEAG